MSTNRLWVIGSVTVMIIVLVAGWFLGAQPFISAAAQDDLTRSGLEAQNTAQQAEVLRLTEENANLDSIQSDYRALQKSIPSSPGTAAFIQSLDALAASAGVQVTTITVSDPIAYTVPLSAVPAPTPEAGADGTQPDPAATAAPVVPSTDYVPVTSPLITPENFVGITVGIEFKGSYPAVLSFVQGLQTGPRLTLVTGLTTTASTDDTSTVSARVDAMIFVLKTTP